MDLDEVTVEKINANPVWMVGVIARRLAAFGLPESLLDLERSAIELALLTAGLDPDAVDRDSIEYRYGAQEALSTVWNALNDYHQAFQERDSQRVKELEAELEACKQELLELRARTAVEPGQRSRPSDLGD